MKIIVLNLPRDLTEEGLAELFKEHGSIDACDLVMDANTGISKGFGFVEMPAEEEAEAAITALHGTRVNKSKIRVKPATS
ncbi:MAG: RNA-binding protein [Alphaproteobacteria bacterium]|nr:RNA-binding protein [Alphaproteobacteria bacterium]